MSLTELYLGPVADRAGTPEPKYHVRLPVFDGPLELLLHLIRKHEVDIYDIPIAEITNQYLEILELFEELNLDLAGEFLLMAATLIHIKSKMLLPPPHEDGTEDEETEDPRAQLVARLLEYERYKEAAQQLHQQEELRNATWTRPESALAALGLNANANANGNGNGDGRGKDSGSSSSSGADSPSESFVEVDLFELISAFREVLERVQRRKDLIYEAEVVSIEEMIERIRGKLPPGSRCTFVDLFEGATDRTTVIVTFLALLEMVRLKLLRLFQPKTFGHIHVMSLGSVDVDAG
jgi:segregation and condensation protein A